jgi:RNA polymerase sigma-70 factor (ECF subfamily)
LNLLDKTKGDLQEKKKPPSPTDEDLIMRFQGGDVYAFEQIVLRYKDPLINYIFHFLGDRIDAEDVVQETFLRVYRNKHLYRNVAKFSTWIYTIAGNLAKTELRRRRRRKIFSLSQMGYENRDYEITDSVPTPDGLVDGEMNENFIRKEIEALPVKFREVVVLRDIQEFSYEEISSILKIPIGTVKSRVNRGRMRLQKKLQPLLAQ